DVEGEQGALIIGCEGRRLGEFRLPFRWGPLWAEVEGPFVAEPELALDEQLARAVLAMLSHVHELMLMIAERPEGDELEHVRAYLRSASGRWAARRLAECTQIPDQARTLAIASWRGEWGVPPDWTWPPEGGTTAKHPLARIGWLPQADRFVSFAELRAAHQAGPLRWIDRGDPLTLELPADVWRLDADERRQIASLLPAALAPFDRHAWSRRHPGAKIPPATLDGAHNSLRFDGPAGERGILAVPEREVPREWSQPTRRGARLRLLVGGHELGWIDVPLPTGPFYGVIEVPNARALPHTDVAAKDYAWRAAAVVIEAAALTLARAELQAWIIDCRHPRDGMVLPTDATRPAVAAGMPEIRLDLARARAWLDDLERGGWPEFAAELYAWHRSLPPDHPLRASP